jgi:hypothetical protein
MLISPTYKPYDIATANCNCEPGLSLQICRYGIAVEIVSQITELPISKTLKTAVARLMLHCGPLLRMITTDHDYWIQDGDIQDGDIQDGDIQDGDIQDGYVRDFLRGCQAR